MSKKNRFSFRTATIHQKINLIFAGVIIGIFLYSGIFSAEKANHPHPSYQTLLTNEQTLSSGLSRSFSCIIRGQLHEANNYNPYGLRLFVFFLIQLIARIFLTYIIRKGYYEEKKIIALDILTSSVLFILFFEPFIKDTLQLL